MSLLDKLFGKKNSGPSRERPKPRLESREDKLNTQKQEPPKSMIEKIPDDIMKHIRELGGKKNNLLNQFLNISAQVINEQTKLTKIKKEQKETLEHVKEIDKAINQKMKYAYDKLKLNKKTDYRWGYDGQGNFVGTKPKVQPQPPKK